MADIRGLLSDPQFNALDVATQKRVLGRVDSVFSELSDADFQQFKSKMSPKLKGDVGPPPARPLLPPGLVRNPGEATQPREAPYKADSTIRKESEVTREQ